MEMTLGAVAETIINTLAEFIKDKAASVLGLEPELNRLNMRMSFLQGVLTDAESRCSVDSTVTVWFNQLKDFMYCADDVIESCKSEGQKIDLEHQNSVVRGFLSVSSWFQNARFRHRIRSEIQRLDERLEDLCNDKVVSLFRYVKPDFGGGDVKCRGSCPLIEPNIVGKEIEYATNDLRGIILRDKEPRIRAYAIDGMGGIGKTTLAQKVFNDPRIKNSFSNRIWVCISQNYLEIDILNQIIRNLGACSSIEGETIGELQCRLANVIKGKSFFLVLDDVWRSDVWTNILRTPLQTAISGTIVITSRDKNVALSLTVGYIHEVKLMSKDSGFKLLCKLTNINNEEAQGLEYIGYQIVKKCGYLPLAVRAIGGLLATREKNTREWGRVLKNDAWSMDGLPSELKGALYLSYRDLPSHLKQCFLFCSLFPQDGLLWRHDLIRSWVAQGFVRKQRDLSLEDVAEEYYCDLTRRSFLQPNPIYTGDEWCTMHDLLRYLGQYLSRTDSFCGDPLCMDITTLAKLKHLSVVSKEEVINLSGSQEMHLRTLFLHNDLSWVNENMFSRLPYLRDLTLNSGRVFSVPNSVGNLSLLRVLNLKNTSISSLPETVCSLKNLQVLNLESCAFLRALPVGLTRLCNMRCLGLEETPLIHVPKQIGILKFLNDISGFLVASKSSSSEILQDGWSLNELRHLTQLRRLQICKLEREVANDETFVLTDKYNLKFLSLVCTSQADKGDNKPYSKEATSRIERTFEKLSPAIYLEELVISNFFGFHFPSWMGNYFLHLKAVIISDCIAISHLPPLGQLPNLRYLRMERTNAIETIGIEFLGNQVAIFPKLETLVMEEMMNLVEWSLTHESQELLPNLKNLTIIDCPNLKALPKELNMAKNLQELLIERAHGIKEVGNLPCLSQWLQIEECNALEIISDISNLRHLSVIWCPALRCVKNLDQLKVLGLTDDLINCTPTWVYDLMKNESDDEDEKLEISWIPVE